jgi:hypothetical protein
MPWPTTYLDVEGAIRAWVNAQTALVGAGKPLPLGVHLRRLRSPDRGAYLLLSRIGGGPDPAADANVDQARLSAAVYGVTKAAAALGAAAYGNLLAAQVGAPQAITGGRLLTVTDITGPLYLPDGDEERYVLDAVFHIQPS